MKRVSWLRAMRSGEGDQIGSMGGYGSCLEILVVRAGAAFRHGPVDDLVRILDVARLAVDAVRRVDLQSAPALAVGNHFIDAGRTEVLARVAEFLGAASDADRSVLHLQMHRLRFVMDVAGKEHRG